MRKIKFAHLSDLHVGMLAHGRLNPSTGQNTRLEDVMRSLDFAVERALRESVDLVLIAGDLFHRENPLPHEEIELSRRLARLAGEGAKVVIVLGNHDSGPSGRGASPVEIFPALDIEGVTIVKKPGVVTVATKSGPVQVACLPWAGRGALMTKDEYKSVPAAELQAEIESRLIRMLEHLASSVSKSDPAILLAHVAARGATLSGSEMDTLMTSEPAVPLSALSHDAFQYTALGHVHRFQNLNPNSSPPVVYSGSIERIDFSEEKEEKGFVLGEISGDEGDWTAGYEFVPTPARRFVTVDLGDVGDGAGVSAGLAKVSADVTDAVVRVRYEAPDAGGIIDEGAIKRAFEAAQTLRVERVFTRPRKAARQAGLTTTMSVLDALDKYINARPELKSIGDEMKSYAEKMVSEKE